MLTMCERRRWVEPTVRRQALKLTAAERTAPEERLGVDLTRRSRECSSGSLTGEPEERGVDDAFFRLSDK